MKTVEYGKENREVIMLLHGGGLSWWNYRSEAETLCGRYHVVLPILDGHAGSDADFAGIEENAERIISLIDREYAGSVFLIGGLSLGAQVLVEMLSRRPEICQCAIIESACVIPSRITRALTGPALSASCGLIRKKWFAELQFRSLHIRDDLFEDYFRDTAAISKSNMTAFLRANAAYELKPEFRRCRARVRIVVGGKERKKMLRSARMLRQALPGSVLEVKEGLFHGEYSINHADRYAAEARKMHRA